jgi:hypothetical protein
MGGTRDLRNEPHVWQCRNYADGRYRVTCRHGHTGVMTLCYGHVFMFRRRMAGMCPRCVHPARARQIEQDINELMAAIPRAWPDQRPGMVSRLEALRAEINDMIARGDIRTGAPLELTEVSLWRLKRLCVTCCGRPVSPCRPAACCRASSSASMRSSPETMTAA